MAAVAHAPTGATVKVFDLATDTVRALNAELHAPTAGFYEVRNPQGAHAIAAGIAAPVTVDIRGHAGYYSAGMNDGAAITVHGTVGTGVAENMMSGTVRVTGDASQSAGATGHGGLLVIEGSASHALRHLDEGHRHRRGRQRRPDERVHGPGRPPGRLRRRRARPRRLGLRGPAVRPRHGPATLGADCVEKPVRDEHLAELAELLAMAGLDHDPVEFRRFGSARTLYHFRAHNSGAY